jgi:hypothetical protein
MESTGHGVLDPRWSLSSGPPKARPGGGDDNCGRIGAVRVAPSRSQAMTIFLLGHARLIVIRSALILV